MILEASWDKLYSLSFGLSQFLGHNSWLVYAMTLTKYPEDHEILSTCCHVRCHVVFFIHSDFFDPLDLQVKTTLDRLRLLDQSRIFNSPGQGPSSSTVSKGPILQLIGTNLTHKIIG